MPATARIIASATWIERTVSFGSTVVHSTGAWVSLATADRERYGHGRVDTFFGGPTI